MSSSGYSVTADALLRAANEWDGEGERLSSISAEVRTLAMGGITAGIFLPITSGLDAVVGAVQARAMQGCEEMQNIAKALRTSAHGYEAHEASTAQSFRMLHS
ncbi:type VII secretion target [Streptacidiphilus sp. MAP5-3]|uniref:type VII secretion target n=1 Tax=unclassified Streptacidiphilus TaxID=2643834 RepID=UPI0035160882